MGQLEHDAGAVTGVRFAAGSAAMVQIDQRLQRLLDDGVRPPALDVDHKAHSAGVPLVGGIVESLPRRGLVQSMAGLSGAYLLGLRVTHRLLLRPLAQLEMFRARCPGPHSGPTAARQEAR